MAVMFAVIQLGGKQYLVKEKDVLRVEKINSSEKTTSVNDVLLVSNDAGTKVGQPFVAGASVELKMLNSGLSDKVVIFKMKAKKRYKRLRGHRQPFTEVQVVKIKA